MGRRVRLTESELRRVVAESVGRMLAEGDWDDIDFSRTRGVRLPDGGDGWHCSPREIKTKIKALQDALKDVMDMANGNRAGSELCDDMFGECWKFYNFINRYSIELDSYCCDSEGEWEEDTADMPFIRTYGDDDTIQPYYDRQGNQLGRERFGRNYRAHQR